MPLLLIGCDGGTNATSGVVPEITRKLYDLTLAGRLDEARKVQYDLVTLFDTMIYSAEFPNGFRAAASLRGFQLGEGRQPMSPEQRTDLNALSQTLQCLLSEHGFTDQPVGGCPIRPGSQPDRTEIDAIVRNVVVELKRRGLN
jgi:4-hydroxy-tetrahydrodipicolinate synthase